jgi:high-affinity iron transporter
VLWASAIPNLLIGLREGLEAGLVVSILLAALRKTEEPGRRRSSFPIWIGVLGAVSVSASFAAVLTFSTSVLSSTAQQAVGGLLSVLAVGIISWMVFWMRRTAHNHSRELTDEVRRSLRVGSGALAVTAFVAVAREGLETTLFLWTAAKASGNTVGPIVGAFVGIGVAVLVCWLLFRGSVRLNLGVFFSRTALFLIVIAAGVLAYGLGDLQEAGWLPGQTWIAFDLTGTPADGSWWGTIISGITMLQPKMTVLSVACWAAYLVVMIPLFLTGTVDRSEQRPEQHHGVEGAPEPWYERALHAAEQRMWLVAGCLVVVPALIATGIIVALPAQASGQTTVTMSESACATEWSGGASGTTTFMVTNASSQAGEINLDNAAGEVVAEIETLGPATTAAMTATLDPGTYSFTCRISGKPAASSPAVAVTGAKLAQAPVPVKPVTVADLTPANDEYQRYAAGQLDALQTRLAALQADLAANDLAQARADWLVAQQDWERVGASYDSFGDLGEAVDGLPEQFEGGVSDPKFTGLHRLEYGLWNGQPMAELQRVTATTVAAVAAVQHDLSSDDLAGDPTNLPLRAHEILEDALRDHLSGQDDEGSGAGYALTYADTEVDLQVLSFLEPLLATRSPKLVGTARSEIATLQQALLGAYHGTVPADAATPVGSSWQSPTAAPLTVRQKVNAALGSLLETLSQVPGLLEVPPSP